MQGKKILLADDDVEDRSILLEAMLMLDAGEVLEFAENGEQVCNMLESRIDKLEFPCLIILDLNMPKLNGTNTLTRIKSDERFKDIPVIIYSTSINPLEKEKCLQLGAHSYIAKPISFKESMDTAKKFLQFCHLV